jgi:SAM-dependent methyltransferase
MKPFIRVADPKVLDIGAYTGIFLRYLKTAGISGIGIEPNEAAARYGRDRFGIDILPIDFEKFQSTEKYDLITLFNVLEHLSNPQSTLIKIRQIISAHGILVIEVPNIFHLFAKLSYGYWHHFQHGHFWFFSFGTLRRLLDRCQFSVEYNTYVPKIVALSKLIDVTLSALKIYHYVSGEQYRRIRSLLLYKLLSSIVIRIDKKDYILVVCSVETDLRSGT